jgi:hypothetical protein
MPEPHTRTPSRLASPLLVAAVTAAVGCAVYCLPKAGPASGEWPGVDESVIGSFVARAGIPEPPPLFAWLQGDLLLFMFLCAGLAAGFVLGYFARVAFFEQRERVPSDTARRALPASERP